MGLGTRHSLMICQNFKKIGHLPSSNNLDKLDDGSGLLETLAKQRASWHKSCRDKYNKTKIKRLLGKESKQIETATANSRLLRSNNLDLTDTANSKDEAVCFFCDEISNLKDLVVQAPLALIPKLGQLHWNYKMESCLQN